MSIHQDWLSARLDAARAAAGTVHVIADDLLRLTAQVGIPPRVVEAVRTIPLGKGMAGLAWQRRQPVETCDLETDETGDVRPGAKAVDAHAAVAIPVIDAAGQVWAVVGFAFAETGAPDVPALTALAADLPRYEGAAVT